MEERYLWNRDEENVFELVKVISEQNDGEIEVKSMENNQNNTKKIVPVSNTFVVDNSHLIDLDDLCLMHNLHEAPLLDILRRRWKNEKMYTYTRDFLVSINPYKLIAAANGNPLEYLDLSPTYDKLTSLPPHVFAIANKALREIYSQSESPSHLTSSASENDFTSTTNQSIIITGESGAGKTEASKQIMSFLVNTNSHLNKNTTGNKTEKIKDIVLQSNVIFESFGNAKTVRNDNSSRFGKYIKLQYNSSNQLCNAVTETFLLEKSRLITVGKNDRNYHIFYQMIRGLNKDTREKLHLTTPEDFKILTSGGCTVIDKEVTDSSGFTALLLSLQTLGFSNDQIEKLWEILACILHLGNIIITTSENHNNNNANNTPSPTETDDTSSTNTTDNNDKEKDTVTLISPTMAVADISSYLGIDSKYFIRKLTKRIIQTGGKRLSIYEKAMSIEEVTNNLYAFIKVIYSSIFTWLMTTINNINSNSNTNSPPIDLSDDTGSTTTGQEMVVKKFIGILDIFGFEIFVNNSFEQLCINYTNERLQQQLNAKVFYYEQQEYTQEGIDWSTINYRDNQPVIDLIGKKPNGLLYILEEHSLLNRKPDDNALLNVYNQTHDFHSAYARPRFGTEGFIVKHFAGDVTYTIEGFLAKNNDSLQEDLYELLHTTSNTLLLDTITSTEESSNNILEQFKGKRIASAVNVKDTSNTSKRIASTISVSYIFRNQLDILITTLRSTKPFYIKCIKPNNDKVPGIFSSPLVMTQLRYSGVSEVVRILREGFPTRMSFLTFYQKYYSQLANGKGWNKPENCTEEQAKQYVEAICREYLPKNAVGKDNSNISNASSNLEKSTSSQMGINANANASSANNDLFQIGKSLIFIRSNVPELLEQAQQDRKKLYAIKLQSFQRKQKAKIILHTNKKATLTLQTFFRQKLAEKKLQQLKVEKYEKIKTSATLLQSQFRAFSQKKSFLKTKESAIRLQSVIRGFIQKKKFVRNISDCKKIQSLVRMKIARQKYTKFYLKSIIRIQTMFRMVKQKTAFKKVLHSIILMQSASRAYLGTKKYHKILHQIILLQCLIRRWKAKKITSVRRKASKRVLVAVERYHLNFQLKMRILSLHELASLLGTATSTSTSTSGDVSPITMSTSEISSRSLRKLSIDPSRITTEDILGKMNERIIQHPEDVIIRNKYNNYCTLQQTIIQSGFHIDALADVKLPFKLTDIFTTDKLHNQLLHYTVNKHPNFHNLQVLLQEIYTIKENKQHIQLDTKETENEEEEEEDINTRKTEDTRINNDNLKSIHQQAILIHGWLRLKNKNKLTFRPWLRRYCVLTDEYLAIHKSPKKNPTNIIYLENCVIDRPKSNDAIFTIAPPVSAINTLSGISNLNNDSTRKDLLANIHPVMRSLHIHTIKAENERELQDWLNPIKVAVGVRPFRDSYINHINTDVVKDWIRIRNALGDNVLHILATLTSETVQVEMLKITSWILDQILTNSSTLSMLFQKNLTQQTPLQVAIIHQNIPFISLIKTRLSPTDATLFTLTESQQQYVDELMKNTLTRIELISLFGLTHPLLLPPIMSKGYTYVQLYFQKLSNNTNNGPQFDFDQFEHPYVTVAVYNAKDELIEELQNVICPTSINSKEIFFGYTFHMQTPLENIEVNNSVVLKLGSHNLVKKTDVTFQSRFIIDKPTINTSNHTLLFTKIQNENPSPAPVRRFSLAPGAYAKQAAAAAAAAATKKMKYMLGLETSIILTKKFRHVDINQYNKK